MAVSSPFSGLSIELARGAAPIAFLIAGGVALLTATSYARLSVAYPSRGGTVTFLNETFGSGVFVGGLNVLVVAQLRRHDLAVRHGVCRVRGQPPPRPPLGTGRPSPLERHHHRDRHPQHRAGLSRGWRRGVDRGGQGGHLGLGRGRGLPAVRTGPASLRAPGRIPSPSSVVGW